MTQVRYVLSFNEYKQGGTKLMYDTRVQENSLCGIYEMFIVGTVRN